MDKKFTSFLSIKFPRPRQSEAMPSIQGKIKTFKKIHEFKNKFAEDCFSAILFFS